MEKFTTKTRILDNLGGLSGKMFFVYVKLFLFIVVANEYIHTLCFMEHLQKSPFNFHQTATGTGLERRCLNLSRLYVK